MDDARTHAVALVAIIGVASVVATAGTFLLLRRRFATTCSWSSAIVMATFVWMLSFWIGLHVVGDPTEFHAEYLRRIDKVVMAVQLVSWIWFLFALPLLGLASVIDVLASTIRGERRRALIRGFVVVLCVGGWPTVIYALTELAPYCLPLN